MKLSTILALTPLISSSAMAAKYLQGNDVLGTPTDWYVTIGYFGNDTYSLSRGFGSGATTEGDTTCRDIVHDNKTMIKAGTNAIYVDDSGEVYFSNPDHHLYRKF
jgi:hypothetical protein